LVRFTAPAEPPLATVSPVLPAPPSEMMPEMVMAPAPMPPKVSVEGELEVLVILLLTVKGFAPLFAHVWLAPRLTVSAPVLAAEVFSSVTAPEPEAIVMPPEPIVRLPAVLELLVIIVAAVLLTVIPPIVCAVPLTLAVSAVVPPN